MQKCLIKKQRGKKKEKIKRSERLTFSHFITTQSFRGCIRIERICNAIHGKETD